MAEKQPKQRYPILAPGVDEKSLPLSQVEGFLVSRMDGETGLGELADSTGASVDVIQSLLAKLEIAGALQWTSAEPPRASQPPPGPDQSSATMRRPSTGPNGRVGRTRVVTKRQVRKASSRPSAKPSERAASKPHSGRPAGASRGNRSGDDRTVGPGGWDPKLVDDPGEIPEERKREILDLYFSVDLYDHYEMLGIERDADKKAVKKAYFALSKRFHPDTFYGKDLGPFKQRMEVVFKRLTEAHKTLTHKKKREEYDDYLSVKDATSKLQKGVDAGLKAAKTLHDEVSAEVQPSLPPSAATPATPAPASTPSPGRPASLKPRLSDDEKRRLARELFAKRLQGATGKKRPTTPPPSMETDRPRSVAERRAEAREGLARSLRASSRVSGLGSRAERYVSAAEEAAARDDMVAATNSLRLALAIDENHEKAKALFDECWAKLAERLADQYERQARYEEGHGDLEASINSWMRVIEGRPGSFQAHHRAASAILTLEGDLREARRLAVRAVELHPKSFQARLTLGKIYMSADMTSSAKKELEEAAKLDPSSEIVKNLLRELR